MKPKKLNNVFAKGAILLAIFILVISSFLFSPQKAYAQFVVTDPIDQVTKVIKWVWEKGGAVAYRNAINFFLQQAAKQSGEYLATGDKGKKPAFLTDPDFFKKAGDQVLGEFIDGMAGNFLGQSLCDTLDPTVKFKILANLDPDYQKTQWAKKPKCSWSQIKKNLEDASKKQLFEFSAEVKEGKVAKLESSVSSVIQNDSVLPDGIKYNLDGELDICPGDTILKCPAGAISWGLGNVFYYYKQDGIGAYLHKYTNEFKDILKGLEEAAPGESKIRKEAELGDQGIWGENADKIAETIKKHASKRFKDLKEGIKNNVWGGDKGDEKAGLGSFVADKLLYWNKYTAECAKQSADAICGYAPEGTYFFCGMGCFGGDFPNCDGKDCLNIMKRANKYTKRLTEWATTLEDMITKITENWEKQRGVPDVDPLEDAANMFNPESNAMGIKMKLENKLFEKQTEEIEKSKYFRSIQGPMNAVTSKVSGLVKLPSTFVSEKARETVKAGTAGPLTTTGVAFADAIGIFANTFLTKYMKTLFEKGLNPAADSTKAPTVKDKDETPNTDTTPILSEVKTIPLNQASSEMTIYDEFAVCPSGADQKYISQFNCLLDNKLVRAVEERMTIQEAMESGFLNPDERLGVPGDVEGLLSKNHIQKLRLIDILPLGAQIASEIIEDAQTSNGVTLSKIVDGFDKRGEDGVCGTNDKGESEFCNLIDPNWVLKAPSYLCEMSGYSAVPLRDNFFRRESCMDLKTCINEKENNQCDTWAYCTRQKNVWRFGGDECDAQYNSCTSYTQKSNKKTFSYLSNTLDFESCSASNVGCKWYCSSWDQQYSGANGDWSCLSPGWRKYTCHYGLCAESLFLCSGGDNNGNPCVVGNNDCPNGTCSSIPNPDYNNSTATCPCSCNGDNGCPDGLGSCDVAEGETSCSLTRPELRNVAFFSDHIGKCEKADQGCSRYIRIKSGLGVNFLVNGSFELPPKDDGIPSGWAVETLSPCTDEPLVQQISPLSAQNGSNVVQFLHVGTSSCEIKLKQEVHNVPLRGDFIVSGYYKNDSDPLDSLVGDNKLGLKICYDESCSESDEAYKDIELDDNKWKYIFVPLSSDAEKSIDHIKVFAFSSLDFGGNVYIDALQLRNETGDSAYREYGSEGITYLKSAPDWMNCYDGDKTNDDADCQDFIQECEPRNVGCESYTLVDGGFFIPAIINNRDLCEIDCVGYEVFQEMPTNFEDNQDQKLVYLIPSTAQKCSAPGCEEFTNIDVVSMGGEGREYYTYLRQCIKTNAQGLAIMDSDGEEISPASPDICKYYYTWVGEETNGYQLKKYYLESDDFGGPAQVSANPNPDWGLCDEAHSDNPHCVKFYDAMGNIYYRLYKNTTTCSTDCSPYRRSIDNSIKMAIGAEAEVCSASDVGCREYRGSFYGNIKNLFLDRFVSSFEPWEYVEISDESVSYLDNSIKADGNFATRPVYDLLQRGKVYSLSLWVKGSGDYIAYFGDDLYFIPEGPHSISVVSNEWQELKFGSIYFSREPRTHEKLTIKGPDGFYIDNIVLNEVQDNVYLIKDSWRTPEVCDIDLEGNIFQGYAVGCQAYWDRNNNAFSLKSFSHLCDEKAVGCEAMIDTQNSISAYSEEFNGQSPQGDEIIIPPDDIIYRVYDTDKTCAAEKKGCQRFGLPELDSNQEATGFTDVYLLNNPDLYETQSILCDITGEGCQEYEGQIYFKDPGDNVCEYRENVLVNGENKNGWFKKGTEQPCYIENGFGYQPYGSVYGIRVNTDPLYEGIAGVCPENQDGCTRFINPVEQNLVLNSGFEEDDDNWNGINIITVDDCLAGHCLSAENNINVYQNISGNYDIGSIYELSAWLKTDGNVQIETILEYIKANGDTIDSKRVIYTGSTEGNWEKQTVELAVPNQASKIQVRFEPTTIPAGKKILIDNVSLIEKNSPKGSYYYLNNDNVDRTSCNAMAGLKDGCVLFNDTSISGSLLYDSAYTYALSHDQGDISVPAQGINLGPDVEGDSNVVLKVRRDRVCGEWLQCSGYHSVWDSSLSEFRHVCDSWIRCDQLLGSGKKAQCGHVVYDPEPTVLDKDKYIERDVSWSGMDYSGYSILNMYPIERLFPSEDNDNPGLYRLTYFEDRDDVGVDGGGLQDGLRIEKTARIYPEKGSPFKASASEYYSKVNFCDSGEGTYADDNSNSIYPDCQGFYKKVEYGDKYGGLTKYFNFDVSDADIDNRNFCQNSGDSCDPDDSDTCPDGDSCLVPSKITKVIGLRGFCLEPDESLPEDINACIAWWPGAMMGDLDVSNLYYSAGFVPDVDRSWYCMDSIFGYGGGKPYAFKAFYRTKHCDFKSCNKHNDRKLEWMTWEDGILPKVQKREVAVINAFLGADTDDAKCNQKLNAYGWMALNEGNSWYAGKQNGGCSLGSFGCGASGCTFSKIKACFDEEGSCDNSDDTAYLDHFYWICDDDTPSGGSAIFGKHDSHEAVKIWLKESCEHLVYTVPDDNLGLAIGYTDRLWDFSPYYNSNGGGTECTPYGAVNVMSPDALTIIGGGGTCEELKANKVFSESELQDLFVKVDTKVEFNKSTMLYDIVDSGWDKTNEIGADSVGPNYAPVIASLQGVERAITIGQCESGNIGPEMSPFVANLKFYAWADTNHMPIREVSIDWDDGISPPYRNVISYNVISKNHRPQCCEEESSCVEFGMTPQACVDKYFSFNHTYICQGRDDPNWNRYACAGMCCFRPKVYIKDNWGWCAGDPGVYAGWDASNNAKHCKDEPDAGISYGGIIKVMAND